MPREATRRLRTLHVCAAAIAWCARVQATALDVHVPPECGSSTEFEREVEARVGSEPWPRHTRVTIARIGRDYRLSMQVGQEQRELEDADCRKLFRAAVVILVAIVFPESAPGETADAEPAPTNTERAPLREPRAQNAALPSFGIGLGGGASAGLLPRPTPAAELEAHLLWPVGAGIAIGARYLAPGDTQDDAARGVSVRAVGGHIAGVYEPTPAFQVRLGIAGYRLSGVGLGSPRRTSDFAWAGGPTAGVAYFPLRRAALWLSIGAEADLHVLRPSFEILNYGEVFSVPLAGGFLFFRAGHLFL